jgi:hypothetical protein
MATVNQIPSEILSLIPDFWDEYDEGKDRDLVTLTHVCRAWREVFISRSSLWINLDCVDEDQARIYLERSKSLPVNLSLDTEDPLPSHHPFLKIIPHAIGRLKTLSIVATADDLEDITTHLPRSAPLLQTLSICRCCSDTQHLLPVLAPTLFDGDLSSLRALNLESIHTKLPWKNMVNLTSLNMYDTSQDGISIRELLDFFESAPRLREVDLHSAAPTSGAQNGRLVSLPCLERMGITGSGPATLLLDHLLIPVGACLTVAVDLPIKNHPPRFLDNLRNFPNFTDVDLYISEFYPSMQFSGPNGQVTMFPRSSRVDRTYLVLESLDNFDTSKVERLEIHCHDSPSSDPPYRMLLPMERLRTLTLYHCASPHIFVHALHPIVSSSGVVVCPELEKLVIKLDPDRGTLDMKGIIGVAAARALRGAKLKSVKIIGQGQPARADVWELEKYVLHVECCDDIGEEGRGKEGGLYCVL